MATEYPFVIYDTAVFGVTASIVHTLFQVSESGDATHTPFFTNMRGAGQFPNTEKFLIQSIDVFPDADLSVADLEAMWFASYLRLVYKDTLILSVPLRSVAGKNSWGGHFTQAVAADAGAIGLQGNGYLLPRPQLIEGGNAFRCQVGQGTAMSGAGKNIKVALNGVLTVS